MRYVVCEIMSKAIIKKHSLIVISISNNFEKK